MQPLRHMLAAWEPLDDELLHGKRERDRGARIWDRYLDPATDAQRQAQNDAFDQAAAADQAGQAPDGFV